MIISLAAVGTTGRERNGSNGPEGTEHTSSYRHKNPYPELRQYWKLMVAEGEKLIFFRDLPQGRLASELLHSQVYRSRIDWIQWVIKRRKWKWERHGWEYRGN